MTVCKQGTSPGLSMDGGRLQILFEELSPLILKYRTWRQGLIDSPEVRFPMTKVSAGFASRIDVEMERRAVA